MVEAAEPAAAQQVSKGSVLCIGCFKGLKAPHLAFFLLLTVINDVLFEQMQEAAGAELDATINQRQDLNVSTHEERKGGDVIDVR